MIDNVKDTARRVPKWVLSLSNRFQGGARSKKQRRRREAFLRELLRKTGRMPLSVLIREKSP